MPHGAKTFQLLVLAAIVCTAGGLMLYAAKTDAPTFDESAHIPAGYSYVRYFDYRLNHEHPPLVKALAGLPLLLGHFNFPITSEAWSKDVNGQWRAGAEFFYNSGNDAELLVFLARLGPIFITLVTIVFVYIFARRIVGNAWALLPTLLFGLSPNILAHGHYVTTDIGATLGVLAAFYFFLRYLEEPSPKHIIYAGVTLGVAELMKFSNMLIGPIFVLFFLVYALAQSFDVGPVKAKVTRFWEVITSKGVGLILIFFVGFTVIYLAYALFTWNYPGELAKRDIGSVIDSNFKLAFLRDLAIDMADIPLLKPFAVYLFGILSVLQRAAGGNAAFFLGELSGKGWWYYFPVVYLLKEPLPILIMVAFALLYVLQQTTHYGTHGAIRYVREHMWETAMFFFIAIYWVNSIASPLNIGIRHIIPTLPFIYILSTKAIRSWLGFISPRAVWGNATNMFRYLAALPKLLLKSVTLAILLFWFILGTVAAAPFYLSYFNELTGSANGYRFVTDSNYDWGQDLYRLRDFVERNNIQKIAVDYFGGGSPKYTLGAKEENWWSSRGNPKDQGIEWLAISTNALSGILGKPLADFERKPEDEYRWLQDIRDLYKPDARAGYSIFIYKL